MRIAGYDYAHHYEVLGRALDLAAENAESDDPRFTTGEVEVTRPTLIAMKAATDAALAFHKELAESLDAHMTSIRNTFDGLPMLPFGYPDAPGIKCPTCKAEQDPERDWHTCQSCGADIANHTDFDFKAERDDA